MKNSLFIILIIAINLSCVESKSKEDSDNLKNEKESKSIAENKTAFNNKLGENKKIEILKYAKYYFPVSYNDSSKIGYPKESYHETGPRSIDIYKNNAYIVDPFFDKIWKINLDSGKVVCNSKKLSMEYKPRFSDILAFNDKIYVSTELSTTYIYSTDLILLDTIETDNDNKSFIKIDNEKFGIEFSLKHEIHIYNLKHNLIEKTKMIELSFGTYKGRAIDYDFDSEFIKFEYGTLLLKEKFKKNFNYDYSPIAYNEKNLAYFYTDKTGFFLYVYWF